MRSSTSVDDLAAFADDDPRHWGQNLLIATLMIAAVLLLPPAIYAGLVWKQFGFLAISGYVPHEALKDTVLSADLAGLFQAPLVSVNMTSGDLLSNMFDLTVGQFVLSLILALAIAWNMVSHLDLRRYCAVGGGGGAVTAAGSGMLATISASSTGIMGCCGSGIAGGVLSLAGVSAGTAAQVAEWSTPIQFLIIAGFAFNGFRLRKRLKKVVAGG